MDKTKVDLNKPAFGEGSQKPEDLEEKKEEVVEEAKPEPEETQPSESQSKEEIEEEEEEQRVPYSRFKKYHDIALEASEEARRANERLEALESQNRPAEVPEMPSYWVKLYGDSEGSKEGWKIEYTRQQELSEQVKREALDAIREEQHQEVLRTEGNLSSIDSELDALSDYVGRDLTEKEQSAILDIVDEYTPKDDDGNYAGPLIPFDKAWKVYQLEHKPDTSSQKSRDSVASKTGLPTHGEPSAEKAEADKRWNPSWGALDETVRKKIGQQ